jgi:hypothetical protein
MVSSDKAKSDLGFEPVLSVQDGIVEIRDTMLQRRIPNISVPRFSNAAALQGLFDRT